MPNAPVKATVQGRYYWELVFDFNNTNTLASVRHEYTHVVKEEVNRKEFMSSTFSTTNSYTFKNEVSAKLSYKSVEAGATTSFEYHKQTANELVNTSETQSNKSTEYTIKRVYDIPANSKLSLYQLHYTTNGVTVIADVFINEPRDALTVSMDFECSTQILGLNQILDKFLSTTPGSSNKIEWESIRNSIVANSTLPDEGRFKAFVENLYSITPGGDNIKEWSRIRETCLEIKNAWDGTDKQLLLLKLLNRFLEIKPERDNKDEWDAIRKVADDIKSNVKVA